MTQLVDSAVIADRMLRDCLSARVRMLSRAVTGIYDEELRTAGIRTGQLSILGLVARNGPMTPSALEQELMMDRSTVSRTVRRMCDRGWLATRPCADARSHHLEVTDEGTRVIALALPAWRRAQSRARDLLGEDGFAALIELGDTLPQREP